MKSFRTITCVALAAALPLAACQKAPETTAEAPAVASPDAKPGLAVSDGVLVLPAVKGNPGAVYFTLSNTGAATSLSGVHIEGAGKAEMHETKDGAMQPLDELKLDTGATAKFERGGKHIMAFELSDTLKAGGTAEMTLTFAGGDKLSVPLKIETVGGGMGHTEAMEQSMEHMH